MFNMYTSNLRTFNVYAFLSSICFYLIYVLSICIFLRLVTIEPTNLRNSGQLGPQMFESPSLLESERANVQASPRVRKRYGLLGNFQPPYKG